MSTVERALWREYITLAKPRIIAENVITCFGGFWLASKWDIDWLLLLVTTVGLSLVMASACAFNNVLDRERDMKMKRTEDRALPTGRVKPLHVIIYGTVLALSGLTLLYAYCGVLTALLALAGHFVYVVIYTAWLKPTSTWSTSVGGISGSVPPVVGYCAVTGELDLGAWMLFAILFLWQPPHFWALGIRRKEEYRAAGFPLLPVVKGVKRTKIQMIPYLALMYPVTILLYAYGYAGMLYLLTSLVLLTIWMAAAISGFWATDEDRWAKKTFVYSLYYLTFSFIVLIVDTTRV